MDKGEAYKSLRHFSKDNVFAIEPSGLGEQDVELRAIGISAVVSHGHPAGGTMTQQKVLIIKSFAIDALTCERQKNRQVVTARRAWYNNCFVQLTAELSNF